MNKQRLLKQTKVVFLSYIYCNKHDCNVIINTQINEKSNTWKTFTPNFQIKKTFFFNLEKFEIKEK